MAQGTYELILVLIAITVWIHKFFKGFLLFHSEAILKVMGLGRGMHFLRGLGLLINVGITVAVDISVNWHCFVLSLGFSKTR